MVVNTSAPFEPDLFHVECVMNTTKEVLAGKPFNISVVVDCLDTGIYGQQSINQLNIYNIFDGK